MWYKSIKKYCGIYENHSYGCFVVFKESDIQKIKNILIDMESIIPTNFDFFVREKNIINDKLILNETFPISYTNRLYLDQDSFYNKCSLLNIDCLLLLEPASKCATSYPTKYINYLELLEPVIV